MNGWRPCKRREFIRKLQELGFESPEPGTRHFVMRYGSYKQVIPGNAEFSIPQLRRLLHQVEAKIGRRITSEEWALL